MQPSRLRPGCAISAPVAGWHDYTDESPCRKCGKRPDNATKRAPVDPYEAHRARRLLEACGIKGGEERSYEWALQTARAQRASNATIASNFRCQASEATFKAKGFQDIVDRIDAAMAENGPEAIADGRAPGVRS